MMYRRNIELWLSLEVSSYIATDLIFPDLEFRICTIQNLKF